MSTYERPWELSKNMSIQRLIDVKNPKVLLLMRGVGPKTEWSTTADHMFFKYNLPESSFKSNDFLFATNNWYYWDQNRNTKIRTKLLSSHYMISSLGNKTSHITQKGANLAAVGVMYTAAAGLFLGGIYAAIQVQDPETAKNIVYLTGGLGLWIIAKAQDFKYAFEARLEAKKAREIDDLKLYRMIRFLPSQIQYVDKNLNKFDASKNNNGFRKKLGKGDNQVEFIRNPEN